MRMDTNAIAYMHGSARIPLIGPVKNVGHKIIGADEGSFKNNS